MDSIPLICVIVITNGKSKHLDSVYQKWMNAGLMPGLDLYVCGPSANLLDAGVSTSCIIDYTDPPYYLQHFHINHKKLFAGKSVLAEYLFFVHDRFYPQIQFLNNLKNQIQCVCPHYGAVTVENFDGSPALHELRIKENILDKSLSLALSQTGRLTCHYNDAQASKQVAINGGEFFIKKSLLHKLARPMRWVEMEDDILSFDLKENIGLWIDSAKLITINKRQPPHLGHRRGYGFKVKIYGFICNLIAVVTKSYSVGKVLSLEDLEKIIDKNISLVDPLHKTTHTDFLPSSLEKIMARARIASNGKSWANISRSILGWKLVGAKSTNQ